MWDDTQRLAIDTALTFDTRHRQVGITGQAGTGKTSILREIYQECIKHGYRTVLCAPTGKAAKRISEIVGAPALTIHRLLRFGMPNIDPRTGKPLDPSYPGHSRDQPIPYDIVLADEYAMVGPILHRYLLEALPSSGYLRCFGDTNQLAPVETVADGKSPFQRILQDFPSITLTRIHRTSLDSSIPAGANLILKGRIPCALPDWNMMYHSNSVQALKRLIESDPRKWSGLEAQVISAMRERRVGSTALSRLVQDIVNPPRKGECLQLPRVEHQRDFKVAVSPGDKIIWTKNDYNVNVFNGETGTVLGYDDDLLEIDFGDRKLEIPRSVVTYRDMRPVYYCPWEQIELAYVITTHKAQGSEWPEIAYFVDRGAAGAQIRSNVYTAVTRARRMVNIVGDQSSFQRAVSMVARPGRIKLAA